MFELTNGAHRLINDSSFFYYGVVTDGDPTNRFHTYTISYSLFSLGFFALLFAIVFLELLSPKTVFAFV